MARLIELVIVYGLQELGSVILGGLGIKLVVHSFFKYRKADSEKVNVLTSFRMTTAEGKMYMQMVYLVGLR